MISDPIPPFYAYNRDAVIEVIIEANPVYLPRVFQPVKVGMNEFPIITDTVFIQYGEAWAGKVLSQTKSFGQSGDKSCFSTAQLSGKENNISLRENPREFFSE